MSSLCGISSQRRRKAIIRPHTVAPAGQRGTQTMTTSSPLLVGILLAFSASAASATYAHAGESPTKSFRGAQTIDSEFGSGRIRWFLSARRLIANVASSLDHGRRSLRSEKDDKNGGNRDGDFAMDDDNCWGWQDDWTDDEYSDCWDGTFRYELDPDAPPDRCKKYEPGEETDDWTDICAEWYFTHGCAAADGLQAKECGSNADGAKEFCCQGYRCAADGTMTCEQIPPTAAPTAPCSVDGEEAQECGGKGWAADSCCAGYRCGDDKACYPDTKCAAAGGRAAACGAPEGALFYLPPTCCDELVCSENGDHCVAPPPPTECIDSASRIVYQTPSGFQRSVDECSELTIGETSLEEKCSRTVVGDVYRVQDYCPVTCGICNPTPPTTLSPTSVAPTVKPTAQPTAQPMAQPTARPMATQTAGPTLPVVRDHSMIPFSSFSMAITFPTELSRRHRALLTYDENELEEITADYLFNVFKQFEEFSSVALGMEQANENVDGEHTMVSYMFSGVAHFRGSDFSKWPTPSEIDATILESFEDDAFVSSLQASTDPGLASAMAVSVTQRTFVLPPGTKPPGSETPQNDRSLPVGVIAGVAGAVCILCVAFTIGLYRRRKNRTHSPKLSSPLSTQTASFDASPSSKNKYYEEMSFSDGASNLSGLDHDKVSISYTDQGGQEFNPHGPNHDNMSLGDEYSYGGPEWNPHGRASSNGDNNSCSELGTSIGDDQSLANMSALGEVRLDKVLSLQSADGYGTDLSIGGESEFNDVWKEGQGTVTDGNEDEGVVQLDYGSAVTSSVLYQGSEKPVALEVIKDDSLEKSDEDDGLDMTRTESQSSASKSKEDCQDKDGKGMHL